MSNKLIPNQSKAGLHFDLEKAILNGKKTVTLHGKTISLPEPQKSGTYAQQAAYASQQADKLVEANFKFDYTVK